jgi:hypothetical protein
MHTHRIDVVLLAIFLVGLVAVVLVPFTTDIVFSHRTYRELLKANGSSPTAGEGPQGVQGLARASMAFAVIVAVGFALAFVLVERPFSDNKTIAGNVLVALTTTLASITAFYFGSRLAAQASQDAAKTLTAAAASRRAAANPTTADGAVSISAPSSPASLDTSQYSTLAPITIATQPPGQRVIGFVASGDDDGTLEETSPGEFRYSRGSKASASVTLAFQLADGTGRAELTVTAA